MTATLAGYGDGTYGAGAYGGVVVDARPRWLVQYQAPDGAWLDATCDVRSITVDRGRATYNDAFRAGTLEVAFANMTGKYSTWPSWSVWRQPNGYITGVAVRVGVALDGAVSWRFTGTTDAVEDSWPGTVDAVAVMRATDAFKLLARYTGLTRAAVGAGERTGARVLRILADAAYIGPTAVDTGAVAVQATTLAGIALDQLRLTGEAEWGWLYINGDGAVVFRQRDAAETDPRMTTVQYTFTDTDALAGACYGDATELAASDDHIITTANITPAGSSTVSTFTDAPARAWYGPRTYTRTDLPIANDVDAAALAQLVVSTYRSDARRIDAVTFDAAHRPGNYAAAWGTRITDRVRFVRTLPGGWQVDAELLVQGRHDEVVPAGVDGYAKEWTVTLATASAASVATLGGWDVGTWDESTWGT